MGRWRPKSHREAQEALLEDELQRRRDQALDEALQNGASEEDLDRIRREFCVTCGSLVLLLPYVCFFFVMCA